MAQEFPAPSSFMRLERLATVACGVLQVLTANRSPGVSVLSADSGHRPPEPSLCGVH